MKIDFVSNFELEDNSGGWNGINYKFYGSLSKIADVRYCKAINPRVIFKEKIYSKICRVLGFGGDYFFYSNNRLNKIKELVDNSLIEGDLIFYFGATPWVKVCSSKSYAVYLDICFPRYLEIFLSNQKFRKRDIARIADLEAKFLSNAKHIFWGSNWALRDAERLYKRDFPHSTVVSTGGHIPIPDKINLSPEKKMLFVSLNFEKKGGWIAYETFKELKKNHPALTLSVIGEKPPETVCNTKGINYLGRLNKNKATDLTKLIEEMNSAYFLIHPTAMDTMGAVIAEAGYHGLPAIAANNFGIPDLIEHEKTGILVDLPLTPGKFADAICYYLLNNEEYVNLRTHAREFMTTKRTWESIAQVVYNKIKS